MDRNEIISSITENKIIVILRGLPRDQLLRTAEAVKRGGIRLCEVTFHADGAPSDEEVGADIRALVEAFGEEIHIGAGTVLTERQAEIAAEARAEFIISPDVNPDVIRKTRELGLVSCPGALTASEATLAHRAGADFVKLFPVGEVSPSYLRAITIPLPHIRFLAVGGVNEENLGAYLRAGAVGAGIASGIVDKELIAAGDYNGVTALAQKYVAAARAAAETQTKER